MLSPEALNEKMNNIGMYNLMSQKLNTNTLPRTFIRGRDAIDHVWMTRYLADKTTFAGYAPFESTYVSDHRGLYFDFPKQVLFPTSVSKIVPHKSRKLKSSIPKRVKAYLKILDEEWTTHKMYSKFQDVAKILKTDGITPATVTHLNNLNKQITEIMLHAENRCTNVSSHHPDFWSPELSAAIKNKRFWKAEKRRA